MERRHFLALWSLIFAPSLKSASPMKPTPPQTEGPFYPVVPVPLRQNLILQSKGLIGEPIFLQGKVMDTAGNPLSEMKIEIWQCDGQASMITRINLTIISLILTLQALVQF